MTPKFKQVIATNSFLANSKAATDAENSSLRSLCDDAYGLIVDHHKHGQMVPSVCGVCSSPLGKQIMRRLERIRGELNVIRVMAKQDKRQKRLGYDNLGPRQLDELGDDEP